MYSSVVLTTFYIVVQPSKMKSSSTQTETLHPWNNNSSFSTHPSPSNHHSILFLWIWLLRISHIIEIILCLSFYDWLISHSIMSSRFTHGMCQNFLLSQRLNLDGGNTVQYTDDEHCTLKTYIVLLTNATPIKF